MSRGGKRIPGEGKTIGRPPMPDSEKCIPKVVYLPPWCWRWIAERGTNGLVVKDLIVKELGVNLPPTL